MPSLDWYTFEFEEWYEFGFEDWYIYLFGPLGTWRIESVAPYIPSVKLLVFRAGSNEQETYIPGAENYDTFVAGAFYADTFAPNINVDAFAPNHLNVVFVSGVDNVDTFASPKHTEVFAEGNIEAFRAGIMNKDNQ